MQAIGEIELDAALIERFGGRGPRYTSYPTADRFVAGFDPAQYTQALLERAGRRLAPLGLYLHIPFCRSICYYCGCNKIGTKHQGKSAQYITALQREIELVTTLIGRNQRISHLHFGGGTPTFMLDEEFAQLFDTISKRFEMADDGEYSIEVDPRTVTPKRLWTLRALGLNRISLGIQDFDPEVQKAVNRVQSYEDTRALIAAGRDAGFHSINVDLIYGLPKQTVEGFERTLALTIDAAPDRVALYHYAHLPHLFKPQRRIHDADLPSAEVRSRIFDRAVQMFRAAGYVYLGLDHFARADDELAVAQREGRLHRNFQGYCSHDAGDLIAVGVSSISAVGSVFAQNEKSLEAYYARLMQGELPIARGLSLGYDDFVRADVIKSLMCNFRVWWPEIEARHGIQATRYFADAITELGPMNDAGAISITDKGIEVLPKGRLLVRAVAMAFDRYLKHGPSGATYSKIA
ncbi:MAG TPA: oxygen-independent coproporphyrinogen III oxidase [Quisquiliibacterium sp.]|nr:oxygen-independent coproporphyrinogen III oxidase [Quisquiliibacterium sp.]HPA88737.1 oxygen-independent coproporphyrinogen III oxidase [Quisquiliibacterium sp.]HQD84349.1 oxygen-independent coproporphyrinogen III oxidase [Quisquiliibacterium sp.]